MTLKIKVKYTEQSALSKLKLRKNDLIKNVLQINEMVMLQILKFRLKFYLFEYYTVKN